MSRADDVKNEASGALRTPGREMQELLEVLPEAVVVVGADWRFRYANAKAREIVDEREMVGEDIFEHFPGNLEEPFVSAYRTTMRERIATEFVAFHPAPLQKWVKVQAQPFDDGIVIFFSDVTAQRQAEERLRESETRYRVLADLNPQAIWMGDARGEITYANQGFLAFIGLTPENLNGRGWLEAFAPEDHERVVAAWTQSVSTGVDYDFEGRLRHAATGEYRWWRLRAAPVRDQSGSILHWLGVGNDLHDSKTFAQTLQAEKVETERQRAELEAVYETAPIGLASFDPVEFRFLRLNERQAQFLGLPKGQILGRLVSQVMPLAGLVELLQQAAGGNPVRNGLLEGELSTAPGEQRSWSVNYFPVYASDGTVESITAAMMEVTVQKKSEAALIQSEKLAAVGRLASSISHEINNPLEAITNLLYLIATDKTLPEGAKGLVHMAESELSRVSQIATQTLRFHRQAVNPTLVTAEGLVGAVIQLYTGRLANSNIKVDARYDTQTDILCFENDIRQVLNNLIANAIDAMRQGGRLTVRAHDAKDRVAGAGLGRPGVRITIADNGHGMNRATLRRVFEPFFTTKDLQGTGLGMWISAGIVDRHQGRLQVRSSDDAVSHGTVFTLFLPCEEVRTL